MKVANLSILDRPSRGGLFFVKPQRLPHLRPNTTFASTTRTGERLDIVYRLGDTYLPHALDELDHYLRDHRTGEVRHPALQEAK